MSALGAERSAVQGPILRYAQEAGWTYVSPEDAIRLRRGETRLLLHDVFVEKIQSLNPGVIDLAKAEEVASRLMRLAPTVEGNLQAWEYLRGLKTVFVEAERRERNVTLLDAANLDANAFHVTEEFVFSNGTKTNRPDIVFLINGIPVLIVETKAATHQDGIAEALDQIRRYHRESPELLAVMQAHGLTYLIHFYYGATWSLDRKGLFNWRDEASGDFETLVKAFVAPRRLVRAITEFILFTRKDGELSKVILRPHQMRAVERVVSRAKDPTKKRALIWHTQGSGKTYTMITVAKRLIDDPSFQNPTVLMLVDRNELESQLFGNLESVGFGHVEVARSKNHLREVLRSDRRGLVVSMIHKFDDIAANINTRSNVFVLVDEAHRTTGGDLGNFLMGALPNATYIGFTGTPIDRTAYGKGTFKVFGAEDEKGYLDKYSIRESVEDGTTVPLHYSLAPNDLRVDRERLEREFLDLADVEGVSDIEELNRVLDRAVTLNNELKNHDRVQKVAALVAKHFKETVEPMGYKAFVVAVDRQACALYKQALDKVLPPDYSKVVISAGFNDPPELAKYHLADEDEERIRKSFRKPDSGPKILIVTEKLLTGFDAPILYCMYLDKPMRDHVLLQAIARVNRPYEDSEGRAKPAGFVLDFVGIFGNLEKALAFDSEDVEGVIEGIDVLQKRFTELMIRGKDEFLPLATGASPDKAAENVLEHFRDKDRRHDFYQYFREVEELYEILSPDAFLRPWVEDYQDLARMYQLLRAAYEPNVSVDTSFLRKTEQLVQERTETGDITLPTKVTKLDAAALERLAGEDRPDTLKIFNLLKAIRDLVDEQAATAPYLFSIGERAEQVAKAFEDRQTTTQDALRQLQELVHEYRDAESNRTKTELSPEGFAVFWFLRRQGVASPETVAKSADAAFAGLPHWQRSAEQERELRKSLYKSLIDAGVSEVVAVVDHILRLVQRRSE